MSTDAFPDNKKHAGLHTHVLFAFEYPPEPPVITHFLLESPPLTDNCARDFSTSHAWWHRRWMKFAICRCVAACALFVHQEVLPAPKWAGAIAHWRGGWATRTAMFASGQLQMRDLPMTLQKHQAHDLLWFMSMCACTLIYRNKAILQFQMFCYPITDIHSQCFFTWIDQQ